MDPHKQHAEALLQLGWRTIWDAALSSGTGLAAEAPVSAAVSLCPGEQLLFSRALNGACTGIAGHRAPVRVLDFLIVTDLCPSLNFIFYLFCIFTKESWAKSQTVFPSSLAYLPPM